MKKGFLFKSLAIFLLICGTTNGNVFSQNIRDSGITVLPEKPGAPLPLTFSEKFLPRVIHAGTVAPDILCIEMDACQVLPAVQIPYQPDALDVVTVKNYSPLGEPITMRVSRNGFPLGLLVGKDRKTLTLYERLTGEHLDTAKADNPASYLLSSHDDPNYFRKITPLQISRKSKPVNWPEEDRKGGEFYAARHFIYLKLPYALIPGKAYLINMPDLNLRTPSFCYVHDPLYTRSEAVHVSQIGFRADDPDKNAFFSVWTGNGGGVTYPEGMAFSLVDEKSNKIVYTGKVVLHWEKSVEEEAGTRKNHCGTDVYRIDFSRFNIPGRYRISVEGIGCSYPFDIDDSSTWRKAFGISMKGHFHQRSGIPMGPPYTVFVRPRSFHPEDGVKVYQSTCSLLNSGNGLNALGTDKDNFGNLVAGKTDELVPEAWGGTMDAGDWDRRIRHLMSPRLYLELMELYPEYFRTIDLNIPESGNDIPDLVDEALFGLDVYRRMQLPDGGIRGGIESSEHPAEGSASWQEVLTVLAYAPDHWSAYIYAGVAARAAVVLRMCGKKDLAALWAKSAVRAMNWAEKEYVKWTSSPGYANVTGHAKQMVPVERHLAAAEMLRLTKERKWDQVYLSSRHDVTSRTEAEFIYARLDTPLVSLENREQAIGLIVAEADRLVVQAGKNAWGISTHIPGRAPGGWESTYSIPAAQTLVRAHFLTGNPVYLKSILRSTLFTAGANPMNLCLTTGLGMNYVLHPLHEDSRHTGQPAPAGLTICGPGEIAAYAKPGSDMERRLNAECTPPGVQWPSAEAYFDLYGWDLQSEYVVDRNLGPTAYIWGYLAARKK